MMEIKIETPLTKEKCDKLKAGDRVLLTGKILTGRDAAHKRLVGLIREDKLIPLELEDAIIFYVGPTPSKPGEVIGSCGPTSSYRMDDYSPYLLDLGLKGMIGKGYIGEGVIDSIKKNGAVYFTAIGGAGALLSQCVKESKVIAYEDLESEAIRELYVEDFPIIVTIDNQGNNLYEMAKTNYEEKIYENNKIIKSWNARIK